MAEAESPPRPRSHRVWLVYLVFFLGPLFLEPTPAWLWAVSGIALGLFLWLYFTAYRVTGLALALCVGGIFGMGAALVAFNPGAVCFLIYAVAFLHRAERPGRRRRLAPGADGCRRRSTLVARAPGSARRRAGRHADRRRDENPLGRAGGEELRAASLARRDRTVRENRRTRTDPARPARPARSHPVRHRAQVRAGGQGGRKRSAALRRGDSRCRAHLPQRTRRCPRRRQRLSLPGPVGRARQRSPGAGGSRSRGVMRGGTGRPDRGPGEHRVVGVA